MKTVIVFCLAIVLLAGSCAWINMIHVPAVGGAEAAVKPAPNITEPDNPLFEGITSAVALFGGVYLFARLVGWGSNPRADWERENAGRDKWDKYL